MTYDVMTHDVMTYDVMAYDDMTRTRKIKQIREGLAKLCNTLTFYLAQLFITLIFGLGCAMPHSDF